MGNKLSLMDYIKSKIKTNDHDNNKLLGVFAYESEKVFDFRIYDMMRIWLLPNGTDNIINVQSDLLNIVSKLNKPIVLGMYILIDIHKMDIIEFKKSNQGNINYKLYNVENVINIMRELKNSITKVTFGKRWITINLESNNKNIKLQLHVRVCSQYNIMTILHFTVNELQNIFIKIKFKHIDTIRKVKELRNNFSSLFELNGMEIEENNTNVVKLFNLNVGYNLLKIFKYAKVLRILYGILTPDFETAIMPDLTKLVVKLSKFVKNKSLEYENMIINFLKINKQVYSLKLSHFQSISVDTCNYLTKNDHLIRIYFDALTPENVEMILEKNKCLMILEVKNCIGREINPKKIRENFRKVNIRNGELSRKGIMILGSSHCTYVCVSISNKYKDDLIYAMGLYPDKMAIGSLAKNNMRLLNEHFLKSDAKQYTQSMITKHNTLVHYAQ